ncbi:MAG: LysE family translocator [Gammaproteobacteria bacterium]|nr:LysE family translocator [Pseudomonadales bacterium]MCP5347718.1 LysE family translocator [Pseudomonadales bacterium]
MTEAFLSLLVTTTLLLGSPGPATLTLAATGATVGFKRGCPFLLGILSGLAVAITATAIGLASLLTQMAQLRTVAQSGGALYIVYLAFRIATSPVIVNGENSILNAPRFRDGFILNLLNVKAYAVFLAVFSGFLLPFDSVAAGYTVTAAICIVVATLVDLIWLWLGGAIRSLFMAPRAARALRVVFALLMVLSVAIVLLG